MRSCTDSELAPERQEPPDDANALAWGVALFWQGLEARSVNPNAETLAFARRDARNAVARGLLENLAADTVPDEIIACLDCYGDSEVAREATTAAKPVGFRSFPNTLSSFANDVIDPIEISRAEWQSAFRDGGAK